MTNKIPEKLTNYSAFLNGTDFLGTVDLELPSLEALTDTVKGAGIAGEIDSPVIGHYGSMTTKLNWRTLNGSSVTLAAQKTHALDFRGSQQIYNAGNGAYEHQGVKVTLRAIPKTLESGKFEVGATTGTANELEVVYYKLEIDGKKLIEIDKFNFISFVDGLDALEEVRKNLGL
ncbi:phage major tail tube protein [Sporosarcina sp. FSL K6-5500]|uniref:phage major tail tube protein n=1 Tax=Sporosarcina sp. FSL K6-5500 TaxID=2921558 RepID=UPI0030F8EB87